MDNNNIDEQIEDVDKDYSHEEVPADEKQVNKIAADDFAVMRAKSEAFPWDKIQLLMYAMVMFLTVTVITTSVYFSVKKLSSKHAQIQIVSQASEVDENHKNETNSLKHQILGIEVKEVDGWIHHKQTDTSVILQNSSNFSEIHIVGAKVNEYLVTDYLEKATDLLAHYCVKQASIFKNISCTVKILSIQELPGFDYPTYPADIEIDQSGQTTPVRVIKLPSETYNMILVTSLDSASKEEIEAVVQSISIL